jgi:NOL1/NOP2/sun family putative RNA methylase
MTPSLPPAFVDRMTGLLGDEADALFRTYDEPARSGLRVNPLKLSPADFAAISPWPLASIPWCETGFLIGADALAGKHSWHAAGLYYLQEPSAMAVAEALDVQPGHLVLDLAAAPGGKATQLAGLLQGEGALVANEIAPARIKPLGENLERFGVTNAIVLNEEPARLAARLGPAFDRVLLDAPCSGEGMFRKAPAARDEWSAEHVAGCALRQSKILDSAARLVRPGGLLLYSTCTFAPEENEAQIARFLDAHPGWRLEPIPPSPGFSPGLLGLTGAVRLWPHRAPGEGHFLALMRKIRKESAISEESAGDVGRFQPSYGPSTGFRVPRDAGRPLHSPRHSDPASAWENFAAATLRSGRFPDDRLLVRDNRLYLRPEHRLDLDGLTVVRPGLPLGEAKPGRFEPSHALALALRPEEARNVAELDPAQTAAYLAGEPIAVPGEPGWTLVTTGGWPLGWAKRDRGILKNHYPKGLRRR